MMHGHEAVRQAEWEEGPAGTLNTDFAKVQTVVGALYGRGYRLVGIMKVKVGRLNRRKNTVRISSKATMVVNGRVKNFTAKVVTATLDEQKSIPSENVAFRSPIGDMTFEMAADGSFKLKSGSYRMGKAVVGGELNGGSSGTFRLGDFDFVVPGELLEDLLPYMEPFSVAGGKWQFARAASVKWTRDKTTKEYGLVVDNSGNKTNLSGLKLRYTVKTGQFKGSFKAYALLTAKGRTKLKKYTVNVIGFVADGHGQGEATCRVPAGGPWTVTVE